MAKEDNFELDHEKNIVLVSVNPKVYPLEVVFSSAYMMMDQAFVVIDGNPETEIVVSLRPRSSQSLSQLARSFNDELLNYAVNFSQAKKTEKLRESLIKQAFAGHSRDAEK